MQLGLSPRVRGNLEPGLLPLAYGRSIPACTGEPDALLRYLGCPAVYPRVYGGTRLCTCWMSWTVGLSPRVRGNLIRDILVSARMGSIPACTGEPLPRPPTGS